MSEQHALTHTPESLDDELKRLHERVAKQAAIIEGQTATIEQMHERIQELEARLAKDSHNSSRPPSSDSPFKKPPPRSRRQPGGRKPGGQPGRRGVTRSLVEAPDQYVIIPLPGTCAGGRGGTGIATTGLAERRQVVEVVIQREVIEYRIVSGTCACGRAQRSTFPAGIEAPVQYGPGGSAFAVYMTPYPLQPYQRTAEVLNERAGLAISPGTLQRTVRVVAARLEAPVTAIRDALVAAPVAHADETGRRVNGNLYRLHVLSTNRRLTACCPHPKRGAEAPDAFGLLAPFAGVLVHDHGLACQRYSCWQAFCNAHHLRELTAIAERSPNQPWATDMIALLCQANALVGEAQNLKALPTGNVERLRTRYDTILTEAEAGNPPHPRRPGTRGRIKQSPAGNLIRRLREHRNKVLRFLTDLRVPCDNNQAECDLRMPKLKQKVSGCFRSDTGGDAFAITRSCLSTRRKQSDDIFNSLVLTF